MKSFLKRLKNLRIKTNNFLKALFMSFQKMKIIVLGDSHAKIFNYINNNNLISNIYFDVTSVGGATALGIANPNSKTNSLKIFKKKLKWTSKKEPVLILLGEVDTGFVIWYQSEKKHISVKEQMDKSLNNYFNFVLSVMEKRGKNIILMTAPLPSIPNNHKEFGEIARLRKEVKASQEKRTELTLQYNSAIRDFCKQNELICLDLDKILTAKNGLVEEKFLNKNKLDHHYDNKAYSEVIVNEFRKLTITSGKK